MFDCHLHVETGLDKYDAELTTGNIIFNSIESYEQHASLYPNFKHSLIFDINKDLSYFKNLIDNNKIVCLKIHSRIQQISEKDYPLITEKLKALDSNIPIIYDAFYYGSDIEFQPNLVALIKLIKTFPDRKFIVAHAGGYDILKYYFHLRTFQNVGYDLSLSLQYLEDSSCKQDLLKLIKFTSHEKLFFGSDYPFASPKNQSNILKNILKELKLENIDILNIFENNWLEFITLK